MLHNKTGRREQTKKDTEQEKDNADMQAIQLYNK